MSDKNIKQTDIFYISVSAEIESDDGTATLVNDIEGESILSHTLSIPECIEETVENIESYGGSAVVYECRPIRIIYRPDVIVKEVLLPAATRPSTKKKNK